MIAICANGFVIFGVTAIAMASNVRGAPVQIRSFTRRFCLSSSVSFCRHAWSSRGGLAGSDIVHESVNVVAGQTLGTQGPFAQGRIGTTCRASVQRANERQRSSGLRHAATFRSPATLLASDSTRYTDAMPIPVRRAISARCKPSASSLITSAALACSGQVSSFFSLTVARRDSGQFLCSASTPPRLTGWGFSGFSRRCAAD